MKKIISGMQPTNALHLGNYLGAIKGWLSCVDKGYDSIAFIADLHAITVLQDPKKLRENVFALAATYIACGLDIKKCPIFVQSSVAEHSELAWILSCFTAGGWLNRMTQYKEKSAKYKDSASLGLYSYPVLQAADILLYQVDYVPVGEDQKQHVELTRDIGEAFNRQTNTSTFKIPDYMSVESTGARIMSLRDGTKKMSKSDESDYSRINLSDDADLIRLKIRKAKSDSIREVYYDKENRPEVSNLLNIYSSFSGRSAKEIEVDYQSKLVSDFKNDLAEILVDKLSPIAKEYHRLLKEKDYLRVVLDEGREIASSRARDTLGKVKQAVGLI